MGSDERAGKDTPERFHFDDLIDGYFPLQFSIFDLMQRRGLTTAVLSLSHAPIIDIPGLGTHEPVPLNIKAGRAGMIRQMTLRVAVTASSCTLCGEACWSWLDGTDPGNVFNPLTRLAEPAYLLGHVFPISGNAANSEDPAKRGSGGPAIIRFSLDVAQSGHSSW